MSSALINYFRPADGFGDLPICGEASGEPGYFRLGSDTICYGRTRTGRVAKAVGDALYDAARDIRVEDACCSLPFDFAEVVENLVNERYVAGYRVSRPARILRSLIRQAYYCVRPILPVGVRKHLQRASLRGWGQKPFPSWPVDRTVDQLLEKIMLLSLGRQENDVIPFIWFWPEGKSACAVMTHDVETQAGLEFCPELMDLDDAYEVKSSFQLIPEGRYWVSKEIVAEIRRRNFEVNIHDWNHDGFLFSDHGLFLRRAQKINEFAALYGIEGFRSGALYRNTDWYGALEFAYDMSVPNCGYLDPQPGGCCTVMPYFIGRTLEIPVTTVQDYSLFHILSDYSTDLWRRQLELIVGGNGLASFIVHPDYVIENRARATYAELLEHLAGLGSAENVWLAKPGDVNRWWRERSQMRLVNSGGEWTIQGPGKERARIAYASAEDERLVYRLDATSGSVENPLEAESSQAGCAIGMTE